MKKRSKVKPTETRTLSKRQLTLHFKIAEWLKPLDCQATFHGTTGGNHFRWMIRSRLNGRTKMMFTSQTPSDHRAESNIKRDATRIASALNNREG